MGEKEGEGKLGPIEIYRLGLQERLERKKTFRNKMVFLKNERKGIVGQETIEGKDFSLRVLKLEVIDREIQRLTDNLEGRPSSMIGQDTMRKSRGPERGRRSGKS